MSLTLHIADLGNNSAPALKQLTAWGMNKVGEITMTMVRLS